MKEIKVTIEGKEFVIDIDKAKELGVLKEDTSIKDFNVGDVFQMPYGNKVIITKTGYGNWNWNEQRYSLAGVNDDLNLYSNFGKEGATKEDILKFLNLSFGGQNGAKFLKNINEDIKKLLKNL